MNTYLTREQLLNEMHQLAQTWKWHAQQCNADTSLVLTSCAADLEMLREAWLILVVKENTLPPTA